MKKIPSLLLCLLAGWLLLSSGFVSAEDAKPFSHVVLVWLKEPGDEEMRRKFVEASSTLNNLPGILFRHVGVVSPSSRAIVDDTFDVAVTVTLKDKKAFKAYMEHPQHKKVVDEQLKPLVNRIVAYDFK